MPCLCLCLSLFLCIYLINSAQCVHFQIAFPLVVSLFKKTAAGLPCHALPYLTFVSVPFFQKLFLCIYSINSGQWLHFHTALPLVMPIFRKNSGHCALPLTMPCFIYSLSLFNKFWPPFEIVVAKKSEGWSRVLYTDRGQVTQVITFLCFWSSLFWNIHVWRTQYS